MPQGLNAPVIYRCWFRGTLGVDWSIANMQMINTYWQFDEQVKNDIMSKYLRGPRLDFRFMAPRFQRSQETLTPGSRFNLRLSSVTGLITEINILVRVTNSIVKLEKVELVDQGGQNLQGGQPITFDFCNSILRASSTRNNPNSSSAIDNCYRVTCK
jgi:hypothetical protein